MDLPSPLKGEREFLVAQASSLCWRRLKPAATFYQRLLTECNIPAGHYKPFQNLAL